MKKFLLLAALLLASCTADISVKGRYGTYSYSPKGGLAAEVDVSK